MDFNKDYSDSYYIQNYLEELYYIGFFSILVKEVNYVKKLKYFINNFQYQLIQLMNYINLILLRLLQMDKEGTLADEIFNTLDSKYWSINSIAKYKQTKKTKQI